MRITNQFEKPFLAYLEKFDAEMPEIMQLKKRADEANSDFESQMVKFHDTVAKKQLTGNKLADAEKELDKRKKNMEQTRLEYQTRLERFQATKEEMTMRFLYTSMTATFAHYASLYKRMEVLQDGMSDIAEYIASLDKVEWGKKVEQRTVEAIGMNWSVLEELKKDDATLPDVTSFQQMVREKIKEASAKLIESKDHVTNYNKFVEVMASPTLAVVNAICIACGTSKQDSILVAMVRIFEAYGVTMGLIKNVVIKEVETTVDPAILFRANTGGTRLMGSYTRLVGTRYMKHTVKELIKEVLADTTGFEVDPTKEPDAEKVKINIQKLLKIAQQMLKSILTSVDSVPIPLKMITHYLKQEVAKKFPDFPSQAIAGFIFLRFFVPAIMNPHAYNLIDEPPNAQASRGFVLISKMLQNLASGIKFGQKEAFMKDLDSFISDNLENVHKFYNQLAEVPPHIEWVALASKESVAEKELPKLHKFVTKNLNEVVAALVKYQHIELIPEFVSVLVQLNDPMSYIKK